MTGFKSRQGAEMAPSGSIRRHSRVRRINRRLGRYVAGISTTALGISVAAMAAAQMQNIYEEPTKGRFQAVPKSSDADPEAAAAATDMILGIPVNTIFFVAAGGIAVFWFTFGGGRKAKVSRH
ncbi:MAG: hypothetical protein ACE5EU_06465 [Paracoccaceae bacterium]